MPGLDWLVELSRQVRESSLKRFRQVQPADRTWRPPPDAASFVDLLHHLWGADQWLFRHLDGQAPPDAHLAPGEGDPARWEEYHQGLVDSGHERAALIARYTIGDLTGLVFPVERWGSVTLAYLLLRGNLDHEIHHRGGLQIMLRLCYAPGQKQ